MLVAIGLCGPMSSFGQHVATQWKNGPQQEYRSKEIDTHNHINKMLGT